jgi:TfoX/Sxy family transcriptional regulator of competence genes
MSDHHPSDPSDSPAGQTLSKAEKQALVQAFHHALQTAVTNARPGTMVDARHMFGGAGFFVNGAMFAAWFGGPTFHLKLSVPDREALMAQFGKLDIRMQYTQVPPAVLETSADLEAWVAKCLTHVDAQPKKKAKKK